MPNIEIIAHPVSNNKIKLKNWLEYPRGILLLMREYNKYLAVYSSKSLFSRTFAELCH